MYACLSSFDFKKYKWQQKYQFVQAFLMIGKLTLMETLLCRKSHFRYLLTKGGISKNGCQS